MKKWLIGGLLRSTLLMGGVTRAAERPSTDAAQTGVTVQSARTTGLDKLSGGEPLDGAGSSNTTVHTDGNADVNIQVRLVTGGSTAGRPPHTDGEGNLMYSILDGVFLGCSLCLLLIRENREREVEE